MYYPTLNNSELIGLRVILDGMKKHPDYLSSAECPYDPDVIEFLNEISAPQGGGNIDEITWDNVDGELAGLMEKMRTEISNLPKTTAPKDKMAYFKSYSDLILKVVNLKERVSGLKDMSEFKRLVMSVLDSVLTIDQRKEVMDQLKALAQDVEVEEEETTDE